MAVVYMSEAEAVNNAASIIERVRQGDEVVIHDGAAQVARVVPTKLLESKADPEHDAMVLAKIEQSLADPRPPLDGEAVEAYFASRRQASRMNDLRRAG